MNDIQINNSAVHAAHCCEKHGCKYGDDDCPVATGKLKQEYPCESCGESILSSIEGLIYAARSVLDDVDNGDDLCQFSPSINRLRIEVEKLNHR